MPNYYLPGVIIMKGLLPSESFVPLTPNLEAQALYQGTKAATKIVSHRKQFAQALYELAYGDFLTICKRLEYADPAERAVVLGEIATYVAMATDCDFTQPNAREKYVTGAYAATEILQGYAKKNDLFEAAREAEEKLTNLPPCLRGFLQGLMQLEDEKTISMVLRLRGPKPGQTTMRMPQKPITEKARNRFKNFFFGGSKTNSTSFNNPRGGHQQLPTDHLNLSTSTISSEASLETMLNIQGGAQEPVGLHFQLNEMTELSQFEKLTSLIFKNQKRILLCAIVAGTLYVFFKKRSALKRFLKPLKKFFKRVFLIYKKITTNRIINNFASRRIWIFSRALSRLP